MHASRGVTGFWRETVLSRELLRIDEVRYEVLKRSLGYLALFDYFLSAILFAFFIVHLLVVLLPGLFLTLVWLIVCEGRRVTFDPYLNFYYICLASTFFVQDII